MQIHNGFRSGRFICAVSLPLILAAAMSAGVVVRPTDASAAGYSLLEQSAEGLGYGFAGAVAGYGDGSEVFFNPAAMSAIERTIASASINMIAPRADFSNEGSSLSFAPIPLGGSNDETTETKFVPNAYVVTPLTEDLTFGFGVNAPFGLATRYDEQWVGRYHATHSELTTINIAPALSYKVWKCDCGPSQLSIGASANVHYLDATLENAVDFGTIGLSTLGTRTAGILGLSPQRNDGFAKVEGDDWAVGFTLGAHYQYDGKNAFGLSWRSRVGARLNGEATFDVPSAAQALQSAGLFVDTGASAGVTLPESLSLGGKHWISDDFAILYETQWTRWSRFNELRVEFDSNQPDSVTVEGWDNVWRYSLGGQYLLNDRWSMRAGMTYDSSPVSGDTFRTPRIPDSDRFWLATGVSYALTDSTKLDVSYVHIFVDDAGTDVSSAAAGRLRGSWDSSVDILAVGLVGSW